MRCTKLLVDGMPAIVCTGKKPAARLRYPRNPLRCEHRGRKRDAQYMCKVCDKLVCDRHGAAASEEEQYCLKHAAADRIAGVQPELF